MHCLISALMLGLVITFALGDDCTYSVCFCSGPDTYCDDRRLMQIPQMLVKNRTFTDNLVFDRNNITTVPAGSLPANISTLSMLKNPIHTIDDTVFDESIHTLWQLSFSEARFTQFPEAVFHLKALTSLSITQTDIHVWNDTGMEGLGSTMEVLYLYKVGLKAWPTWMKSMTHLTALTISRNTISHIPEDALDLVANILTYLDLSHNKLTAIPKTLTKMTVLTVLSLEYNKIYDISWLPQSSRLETLVLNDNEITDVQTLSMILKPHAESLSRFEIQDNSLTSIPELWFMMKISNLDLTNNHISDPNSGSVPYYLTEFKLDNNYLPSIPSIIGSLTRIYKLYLNTNNIQIIQGTEFPPEVTNVDLGYNSITELSHSSFPYNSSIYFLILSNNPITTISPDAFQNIPMVTELDLRETKLTRLPLAIASLRYLNSLDVSNSTQLICTCEEQSLRSVIQSIGSYFVKGDCGVTNVYNFFAFLSPYCPHV